MKLKKSVALKILKPANKIFWKREVIITKLLQEVEGVVLVFDIIRNPVNGVFSLVEPFK